MLNFYYLRQLMYYAQNALSCLLLYHKQVLDLFAVMIFKKFLQDFEEARLVNVTQFDVKENQR